MDLTFNFNKGQLPEGWSYDTRAGFRPAGRHAQGKVWAEIKRKDDEHSYGVHVSNYHFYWDDAAKALDWYQWFDSVTRFSHCLENLKRSRSFWQKELEVRTLRVAGSAAVREATSKLAELDFAEKQVRRDLSAACAAWFEVQQ